MNKFPKDHVFILPHSQEYQRLFTISLDEILLTLNEPDLHEGISEDRYTAEKVIGNRRIYIYYYLTLPLQGKENEVYAVVDYVAFSEEEKK